MPSRANCNHRRHVATRCVLAICICSLGAAFASSVYVASQKVASAAIHRCDPSVRLWQLVRRITHSAPSADACAPAPCGEHASAYASPSWTISCGRVACNIHTKYTSQHHIECANVPSPLRSFDHGLAHICRLTHCSLPKWLLMEVPRHIAGVSTLRSLAHCARHTVAGNAATTG